MLDQKFILRAVVYIVIATCVVYHLWPKQKWLHKKNKRLAKKLLVKLQKNNYEPDYLFGILRKTDYFVFEEFLLLCIKQKGFRVLRNKAYTADGGIDGTFFDKGGRKFLIQAKRYKSAINPQHVKEFSFTVEREKACGGFFIHTGRTGLKSYCNLTEKIRIISGEKLLKLINVNK